MRRELRRKLLGRRALTLAPLDARSHRASNEPKFAGFVLSRRGREREKGGGNGAQSQPEPEPEPVAAAGAARGGEGERGRGRWSRSRSRRSGCRRSSSWRWSGSRSWSDRGAASVQGRRGGKGAREDCDSARPGAFSLMRTHTRARERERQRKRADGTLEVLKSDADVPVLAAHVCARQHPPQVRPQEGGGGQGGTGLT